MQELSAEEYAAIVAELTAKRERVSTPIHRRSLSRARAAPWRRPTSRADLWAIVRAAERHEIASRSRGRKNGDLGFVAIEVLKALVSVFDFKSGRCDPSYNWLAARVRRSRSAVAEALGRLRACGFLEWVRRFEEVADPQPGGPRVRQISNLYRIELPALISKALGIFSRPPIPVDEEERQRDRARQVAEWEASASPPRRLNPPSYLYKREELS